MKYEEYRTGNGGGAIRRRHPDEIERDVREIRSEMSDTLRRLEERVSPRQALHSLTGGARTFGSGSAAMAKNLGSTVRDNPVPLLLIGAGIASLMVSQRRGPRPQSEASPSTASEKISKVRERAAELRGRATQMRERAGEVRGKVAGAGHRAREAAHDARVRGQHIVEDQPLVLVGLAVAAGALLAGLLPMTDKEHRTVGRTRDRVVDRARDVARGAREGLETKREAGTGRISESPSVEVQPTVPVRGSWPSAY